MVSVLSLNDSSSSLARWDQFQRVVLAAIGDLGGKLVLLFLSGCGKIDCRPSMNVTSKNYFYFLTRRWD